MGARSLSFVLVAITALGIASVSGCASPSDADQARQPIPTFSSGPPPGLAGQVRARETLLPVDCADVVPGQTMSALLGQPVDSVQVHTVLGVPAPAVGRLERVACQYQRAGVQKGALPAVELNLAAYVTSAASDTQMATNSAAERADASSGEPFTIGSARAMLFRERDKSVLLVASGRSTVTMTLRDGVVAPELTHQVMVDLAQRVLPHLVPEPAS